MSILLLLLTLTLARSSPGYYYDYDEHEMAYRSTLLASWSSFSQTEEFRAELIALLSRDQLVQIYTDRLLTSMENSLKDKVKSKITSSFAEMKEDLRRQLVESASTSLRATIAEAKLNLNDHVRSEIKSFISNSETIRGYLQQHEAEVGLKMQKVLTDSKAELEGLYRDHLARIIQEDQYRTINAALIEELKAKYAQEFSNVRTAHDAMFEKSIQDWKAVIETALNDITARTTQVSNTYELFSRVQERLTYFETTANWAFGLSLLAVGVITVRVVVGLTASR